MTVAQLKEILNYLQGNGYDCLLVENRKDSFIFIDVVIKEKEIRLRCDFPASFPYDFPKISILDEFLKQIGSIPHLNSDGSICTFDRNVAYPNYDKPYEVVLCTLKKAIKIIEDGLSGINEDDFIDEFKAYWSTENVNKIIVYGIFTPKLEPCCLPYYQDEYLNFFVGESKEQLIEYMKYAHGKDIKPSSLEECLYLPLNLKWYPPYPDTNGEIYLKIAEDLNCFAVYNKFMKNRTEKSLIIFSQEINEEVVLAGWIQKPARTPNGFRKGKIPPGFVYLCTSKDVDIIKVSVVQLNHSRLFYRGGDGILSLQEKISVIGCGSIGSYIVRGLAELGASKLVLIDNETLAPENIARHFCGASDIGKNKVEAIKESLIKHYTDIECNAINKNIFTVLENKIEIINDCGFNFVVVGDRPIETKFIRLINENLITKPVVIVWVEPYLLGGHAVIIQKPQDLEEVLYDNDNEFINKVLADGGKYIKKESGCQSTFIAYSAFEAQQFIYSLLDYINEKFFGKILEGNYLFSRSGKLDWARSQNMMITDMWLAKDNKEIIVKRLG